MSGQALWNRNFTAVCLSSFFLFMTFYTLATTLPIFVIDTLKGSTQQIGLVMTVYVVAAVIFRPFAGKWVDELNRRKMILASLVLFMLCSFAYLVISSFASLIILRIIHGISFGIATTAAGAIVADLAPENRKGEGVGYFSLFMSLAMVLGPFIGLTIMAHFTYKVLFEACSAFALLSVLCGMTARIPERTKALEADKAPLNWKAFIEPHAVPISVAGCFLAFSYGAIMTFLPLYADSLHLSSVAGYFFIVFAAVIVLSRPFTGKLFDRFGEHILVYPGILFFSIGMIGLSQASTATIFLITGGMIGLGFGALLPSFQTIAIKASPANKRGLATGTFFLLFDSGYGLGSYLLGMISAKSNYSHMYLIAGLVVAFTALVYYFLHHRQQQTKFQGKTAPSLDGGHRFP